ncbi:hypothetical protein PENSPDRAFT_622555 [Peniophora sp. CONT]|nr:hypothetical protein PENSPDRAFT_622555 [Peniophora sp. CONT]
MTIKNEPRDTVKIPPPKPVDEKARKDAAKDLTKMRRLTAWSVHRWPVERRVVHRRTRVYLPRSYLAKDGVDVRTINAGSDINQFVFRHYEEMAEEKDREKVNYVTEARIQESKHEFLGPDPRVAGYSVEGEGIRVLWIDRFLEEKWVEGEKWELLDVEMDSNGAWTECVV